MLAELAAAVTAQAQREGVLVDEFVAPVGRATVTGLFSGKKHLNGYNIQVVADVGDPRRRRHPRQQGLHHLRHRRTLDPPSNPDGMGITGDTGYLGCGMITPERKPPGRDLSEAQRTYNQSVNSIRAAAERAISHLRESKTLKTGYRGPLDQFPDTLRTVTRLEVYRVWSTSFE